MKKLIPDLCEAPAEILSRTSTGSVSLLFDEEDLTASKRQTKRTRFQASRQGSHFPTLESSSDERAGLLSTATTTSMTS